MAVYDITQLGSALEFDTTNAGAKYIEKITDTRFVIAWQNSKTVKYVQCFNLNRSTGAITALSNPLNFYADSIDWNEYSESNRPPSIVRINDTKFIIFWTGRGNDGYVQTFQINESTGGITSWSSILIFDYTSGVNNSSCFLLSDSTYTYILNTWYYNSSNTMARVFRITNSTGGITAMGTLKSVGSNNGLSASSIVPISSEKVFMTFSGASEASSLVLNINNSTWEVTSNTILTYYNTSNDPDSNSAEILSLSPLIGINAFSSGLYDYAGFQLFNINNSTWEVSTLGGSVTNISTLQQFNSKRIIKRIDDTHFIYFYTGTGYDGYVRTYEINPSNGVSTLIDEIEFDTSDDRRNSCCDMGDGLFVNSWSGISDDGYVQTFRVELPSLSTNFQINIGDTWKTVESIQINIGDSWKEVTNAQINIGDTWKTIY